MEASTAPKTGTIVERFTLKAFVEACLVLEEGVSSLREIETGMMTGAGILPGPFARADEQGVVLEPSFGREPLRVLADAGQLKQVFLNLLLNALQAMPEGGRITVRAEPSVEEFLEEVRSN